MNDDALKNFTSAQLYLNKFRMSGLNAASAMSGYLPRTEIDVNARVYVELGEREFERHDDNTMPLADFIAEIQKVAAKAPKGAEVVIEMGVSGYDGGEVATYEIGYFRDPTKKERGEREETNRKIREANAEREARKADQEREEFERLKAKFRGPIYLASQTSC